MKTTPSSDLRLKTRIWVAGIAVAILVIAGCNKAPDAPTQTQQSQAIDMQIQAIQNNPAMPPGAKQQAINGLKAQQNRAS